MRHFLFKPHPVCLRQTFPLSPEISGERGPGGEEENESTEKGKIYSIKPYR